MVSSILSTAGKYSEYGAHFLFGTGAEKMGEVVKQAVKGRAANVSMRKALGAGIKDGFYASYNEMKAAGGFIQNLKKTFTKIPGNMAAGWKGASGLSKVWQAIKPLGKAMPFVMNALWFAGSIPDIVGRTKEEGIWGGIKETGKTLINMGVISLAATLGSACFGLGGAIIVPMIAGIATKAVIGKTWGEKKAEEEALKNEQSGQNPFAQQSQVGQKLDVVSR